MLEKIILIRNIFYKCFLISFVYFIFVSLFYMFNKEWAANLSVHLYNLNKENFYLFIIYFIGWMKMFTFYVFLVPALALHWTANVLKKEQK
ncbi:MAG: hypothetical protein A2039_04630 [Candidatus Melainabacteria bacterium GWA2_34_9]|nr:MAG: hypothetical protein A2039_04630 [Candidatus Melainabacteria bacterium GWA2_34_9]